MRLAASAGVRLIDGKMLIGPEFLSAVPLQSGGGNGSAAEANLGAHYAVTPDVQVGAGAGIGVVNAIGTPDSRFLASIAWAPKVAAAPKFVRAAMPPEPVVANEPPAPSSTPEPTLAVETASADPPAPAPASEAPVDNVLEQRVYFATNLADIAPSEQAALAGILATLKSHGEWRVRVEGHTDDVGAENYNERLGRARAESVVRWMTEHGIDARRVEIAGFGFTRPSETGSASESRAKNRRVEFRINPKR